MTEPAPADIDPGDVEEPAADGAPFDPERAKASLAKKNSENANLRKRLRELETDAKELQKLKDAGKSEAQRLAEELDGHKTRAEAAESKMLRLEVALANGLTDKQALRLIGTTKEELEADAVELKATFGSAASDPATPASSRPVESLRPGAAPASTTTSNSMDVLIRRAAGLA